MLRANGIELRIGPRLLIAETNIVVNVGDRLGLVGRNGAGKTTLLKSLAMETRPTKGTVTASGTVGYLPQDPRSVDLREIVSQRILSGRGLDVLSFELSALAEKMSKLTGAEQLEATHRYGEVEHEFSSLGGYSAQSTALAIAGSLGIEERLLKLPLGKLSGGQRRRVELARILFSDSEILLLDEPTNHLDADSISWLRGFLKSHKSGLIVISHDVELLEETVNRVAFLDANSSTLEMYQMGYRAYLTARSQSEERKRKERARAESKVSMLTSQADKMRGSSAKRARTAKVLDRRAERISSELTENRHADHRVKVRFPEPKSCGKVPLSATAISKSYGSLEVFAGLDLAIDRGAKVVVLGLNGAGKTTLLRLLARTETPDAGTISEGVGLSVGYYAQEHETLKSEESVFANLRAVAPYDVSDVEIRSLLGTFMFSGDVIHQKAGTLSGGEKTRLALAALVTTRANVLLLDEPTNNLDPISREQVLTGISNYKGAVVLVTHDAGAVSALNPDRVLLLPDGAEDFWREDYLDLITLS